MSGAMPLPPLIKQQSKSLDNGGIGGAELEKAGLLNESDQLPGSAPPRDPNTNEEEIVPASQAQATPDSIAHTESSFIQPKKASNRNLYGMNRHAMTRDRMNRHAFMRDRLQTAQKDILSGVRVAQEADRVKAAHDPEQREQRKMRELFDSMDGARDLSRHTPLISARPNP